MCLYWYHVDKIIKSLREIQYRALLKLNCWIRDYMDVLSRPERQEVTTRTLPELLIQSLLVTRQWREYYPNVDTWLASLPQARQDSLVRSALNNSLAKLIKDKWPDSHGYRAETHALRYRLHASCESHPFWRGSECKAPHRVPMNSLPQLTVQGRTMHCTEAQVLHSGLNGDERTGLLKIFRLASLGAFTKLTEFDRCCCQLFD